jgi:2,5-diketo-D-gluconate reductase A
MDSATTVTLHTGNQMPVLGLGTWELTKDTPGTIEAAVGLGYRMIDTAFDYGSQRGIGDALRRGEIERGSIYLVAKVEETDDAYQATRSYLAELQTDYADLVLIHRPPPSGAGEDLWRGLMRAREEGLTRDIGVSNYSPALTDTLVDATGEVPVVNQIEWSPFGYSREMLAYCQARGIVIQAYSPLTRARRLHDKTLTAIASKYGKSPAQLLIRWNLQIGTVPLPKANQQHHLREDIAVFDFEINEEDMAALDGLNEHYSSLGATLQYI